MKIQCAKNLVKFARFDVVSLAGWLGAVGDAVKEGQEQLALADSDTQVEALTLAKAPLCLQDLRFSSIQGMMLRDPL